MSASRNPLVEGVATAVASGVAFDVSGVVGGEGWTPEELTLTAWYRADDTTLSGSDVATWPDRSGNGHDLAPGTAPSFNASVAAINNKPSVSFVKTSSEYLVKSGGSIFENLTHVHVVMQIPIDVSDSTIMDCQDSNIQALHRIEDPGGTGNVLSLYSQPGAAARSTTTFNDATWILASFYWDQASSKVAIDNEVEQTTSANPGSINPANTGITVGSRATPGTYADMDVAEIIITPAKVTGADQAKLIDYFNRRYGFGLYIETIYQGTKTSDTTEREEAIATGVNAIRCKCIDATSVEVFVDGVSVMTVTDGNTDTATVSGDVVSWVSTGIGTIELGQGRIT